MDARFSLAGEGPGDSRGPAGEAEASGQQRLQRVLGEPELGWLIDRIRIRLERGEPVDGTVTLVGATAEQRRAAARLLGHGIGRGTSLSVPLPEVDAALRRAGISSGLRSAVESLTGPVRDRAAERSAEIGQFQDVLDGARRSPLAAEPWHLAWLEADQQGRHAHPAGPAEAGSPAGAGHGRARAAACRAGRVGRAVAGPGRGGDR